MRLNHDTRRALRRMIRAMSTDHWSYVPTRLDLGLGTTNYYSASTWLHVSGVADSSPTNTSRKVWRLRVSKRAALRILKEAPETRSRGNRLLDVEEVSRFGWTTCAQACQALWLGLKRKSAERRFHRLVAFARERGLVETRARPWPEGCLYQFRMPED